MGLADFSYSFISLAVCCTSLCSFGCVMRKDKGDDLTELPDVENRKNQQNVDFYLSFEAISPDLLFMERLEIIVCQQHKECFEWMFVFSHISNLHVQHVNILHTWRAVAFHHHTIKSNFTCTINSLYIHESVNLWDKLHLGNKSI